MRKLITILATLLFGITTASAQMSVSGGWQTDQLIRTNVAADGFRTYSYAWSHGAFAGVSSYGATGIPGLGYNYSILCSFTTGTETDVLLIMDDPHHPGASNGQVITDEYYISVPAEITYSFPLAPWLTLSFRAGAGVDYCLSSKSYATWPGIDGTNNWNVDHFGAETNYNGYRRFDLALRGGLGLMFAEHLMLKGGINYGLLDRSAGDGMLHRFSIHAGLAWLF